MNSTKLFSKVFLLIATCAIMACSKKDNRTFDLRLPDGNHEVRLGANTAFGIISGNGNYDFTVDHSSILDASFSNNGQNGFGFINVQGKSLGETKLTVTDKLTGQNSSITLKVVDDYLPLVVSASAHPTFSKYMHFFLVKNDAHDAYFFAEDQDKLTLIQKGSYEFSTTQNGSAEIPQLKLRYKTDDKGQFTDAANASLREHLFDLSDNEAYVFAFINHAFDLNWSAFTSVNTRTSVVRVPYINMKELGTSNNLTVYIGGYSSNDYMPYGYLNK